MKEKKNEYINRVYCTEDLVDTAYYKNIESALENFKKINQAEYSKAEVDKQFRDINSVTVIPDNIYDQNIDFIDNCLNIINNRYIKKDIRSIIMSKISDMTLSLPIYNRYKLPELVDECVIKTRGKDIDYIKQVEMNIHRTRRMYEFDMEKCMGRGLMKKEAQNSIFI